MHSLKISQENLVFLNCPKKYFYYRNNTPKKQRQRLKKTFFFSSCVNYGWPNINKKKDYFKKVVLNIFLRLTEI
jgi:hypothetical protein